MAISIQLTVMTNQVQIAHTDLLLLQVVQQVYLIQNTELAVFNGSEVVDDDGDKTAYNLIVNGEEKQLVLDDDVVISGVE